MKASNLKFLSHDYFKLYDKIIHKNSKIDIAKLSSDKEFNVKDFEFYLVASALYSSKIEGSSLDFNSFYRNRANAKMAFKPKEVNELEDLVSAYKFASQNELTQENFLKAHGILSKNLVIRAHRGKYRKGVMGVYSERGLEYQAVEWDLVPDIMSQLFTDINYLIKSKMSISEVFYYASMIHLWLAKIHPFADGNGRSARLLEKWFLVEKLGKKAWSIKSEKYYWDYRSEYYKNIHIGLDYYHLDWSKCMEFLFMLVFALLKD